MRIAGVAGLIAVLAGPAVAEPRTRTFEVSDTIEGELVKPEGALLTMTPREHYRYDVRAAPLMFARLDQALAAPLSPTARADLLLARADLHAAHAVHEWRAKISDEIALDVTKQPLVRKTLGANAERHRYAMVRARVLAIADYSTVFCEPGGDPTLGLACRAPTALAAWQPMDQLLYRFAYVLDLEHRPADVARVYHRLADGFPRSPYYAEAVLGLAEQAFERADLAAAAPLYREVLVAKASLSVHLYARYKLAWVDLDLGQPTEAYKSFAIIATTVGDQRDQMIIREARRDLVRAYTGKPAAAFAAFERIAPGKGLDMLVQLAEVWFDQGRAAEAIAANTQLLAIAPRDIRICEWQAAIASAAAMANNTEQLIVETERLAGTLARLRMVTVKPEPLAECSKTARDKIGQLAFLLVADARKTKDPRLAELADRALVIFLQTFRTDPDAGKARLQRAELAWDSAAAFHDPMLYELAVDRYREAIAGGGLEPHELRHAHEALELALQRVNP
jgi:tetratricopeptide (TPR) repeat protein